MIIVLAPKIADECGEYLFPVFGLIDELLFPLE